MTVSSATNKVVYEGNGIVSEFAVPFYFLENSDIEVWSVSDTSAERKLEYGTEYSVSGAGDLNGGSVILASVPQSGERLTVIRNVPMTQETDYRENEIFPAETQERALDKLTMMVQQNAERLTRTLTLGVTSEEDPDAIIPRIFEAETESANSARQAEAAALAAQASKDGAASVVEGFDEHAAEKQAEIDASVDDAKAFGTTFAIVSWS